jgi:hypothetical protein
MLLPKSQAGLLQAQLPPKNAFRQRHRRSQLTGALLRAFGTCELRAPSASLSAGGSP